MEFEKSEINNVAMMFDLENNINFKKWIDFRNQGQLTGFKLSEILDIVGKMLESTPRSSQ